MVSLRGELADAHVELGRARERIAELEARLAQTPRNSSKLPSSEGLAKPRPRSLRKKAGAGGEQDGQKATTLAQVARPDRAVRHEPGCCARCGAALAGRPVTGVERRLNPGELAPAQTFIRVFELAQPPRDGDPISYPMGGPWSRSRGPSAPAALRRSPGKIIQTALRAARRAGPEVATLRSTTLCSNALLDAAHGGSGQTRRPG